MLTFPFLLIGKYGFDEGIYLLSFGGILVRRCPLVEDFSNTEFVSPIRRCWTLHRVRSWFHWLQFLPD